MNKLTRSDLLSLERYAAERTAFRARVIAHKRARAVALGSPSGMESVPKATPSQRHRPQVVETQR